MSTHALDLFRCVTTPVMTVPTWVQEVHVQGAAWGQRREVGKASRRLS